ncbi:MAG: hypothetical protein IBJ03_16055 [Gemmatimonadaceae bacterium]|nr:hypothetical protein [Gemmatimonadaceae bacterium]
MISAHGGYIKENSTFTVPDGVRIIFYGEHGAALLDPGIGNFARDSSHARPREVVTGGQQCLNYLLSKYQGAHAGSDGKQTLETYKQVADTVSGRDTIREKKFSMLMKASASGKGRALETLMDDWGGSILTVRNRWNILFGIPLKTAISAARKEMPTLREFHCIFCRSYMMGEDKKAAQDVQYQFG